VNSLKEMIRGLGEVKEPPNELALAVVAEDDKAAEAMSLKLSGVPIQTIAKRMGGIPTNYLQVASETGTGVQGEP